MLSPPGMRVLPVGAWLLVSLGVLTQSELSAQSVARGWDEQILEAIRHDTPHPPVHARNLFHLSISMYDAWAAYDTNAVGYLYRAKHTAADVAAARHEAISYAAYRILKQRYVFSKTAASTLAMFDQHMASLGYDTNYVSANTSTPAGIGNAIYQLVSGYFLFDGAYETYAFVEQSGYYPANPELVTWLSGNPNVIDINRWQPLAIQDGVDQNGFPTGPIQTFLGSQWLWVRPFALSRTDHSRPWIDPGPHPHLHGEGDAQLRAEVVELITRSGQLTPDDGVMIDVSPGARGNNSLGMNNGSGHPVNPATGLPYSGNLVKRGDYGRVLAEFWADGPNSETPPGHWNTIANQASDNTNLVKRIGGVGPVVDDLEWDVKLYFVLNAAVHDVACAAWSIKRYYDSSRPIALIRYMGGKGQSSEPGGASYDPSGLPLLTNLIELVTTSSAQPGQRHDGLTPGKIAIHTWPGQPADPANQYSGVRWIEAERWFPY